MVIGVLRTCVADRGAFFALVRRLCDTVLITAARARHLVHVLEERIARPLLIVTDLKPCHSELKVLK